jgi:ATP-binding cassette subfamily A (ABC1) protein 5
MITAIVHLQEVVLPLYSLWILIVIKYFVPNPNFPVMSTPRGEADLFEHFQQFKNHTIAIVPNTTETQVSISHIIYQ